MNTTWRQVSRWLLGEDFSPENSSVEFSLESTWNWPPWVIALLAILLTLGVTFVYSRERGSAGRWAKAALAALRLAGFAVLLFMLYGWMIQRHRTDLPDVVIVLDDSQSMSLADTFVDPRLQAECTRRLATVRLEGATRLNLAKLLLLENEGALLAELSRHYHLKLYLAGGSARVQGSESEEIAHAIREAAPAQSTSRLGRSLREALEAQRGRPTAAVLMLTDGVNTEGKPLADAAEYARRKGIPLFFVGLGGERPPKDLRLSDLLVDEFAFVNDLIQFDFKLTAEGVEGEAVVRLKRKGDARTLAQQTVKLTSGTQSVRLSHRAEKKGEFEYTLEIEPQAGEINVANNRLTRTVVVREDTIRVLLVQAGPSYEFRFLKAMLERELNRHEKGAEKNRGFRVVLQDADPQYVESDKSAERVFPVSKEELFKYDVLIFGDVNPSFLSASVQNNIHEFVTVRGGGLIFISGPRFTPLAYRQSALAPLFPINLDTASIPDIPLPVVENFRPRLTPLGLASPQLQIGESPAESQLLWNERLPPLHWFVSGPDVRVGVRVLAEHPGKKGADGKPLPIITLQFIGAGKVVFHATDETHRWRFRAGDLYFARYWVQTIRYLSRAKLLGKSRAAELTSDRDEYRRGESVRLRARFFDDRLAPAQDDGVTLVMEQEGGQRRNVTLRRDAANRGVFEGTVANLGDGKYRTWLASPTLEGQPPARNFSISAPPGEFARLQMDAGEMRQAAKVSGGKFYLFSETDALADDLPRGRQVRIESLPPKSIWNAPLLAGLFVTLIGSEWLLRKRWGLV